SWLAQTSLRRAAAELLGMPRSAEPTPDRSVTDVSGHTQEFTVAGRRITTAAPAMSYPGGPAHFAAPRPWGQDDPSWV
ncbi:MAG: carnitine dehydratase, partial [Microbacterium sp.]